MMGRYDAEVVKNLMPLVVNVLENMDLGYTEKQGRLDRVIKLTRIQNQITDVELKEPTRSLPTDIRNSAGTRSGGGAPQGGQRAAGHAVREGEGK